MVQLLLILVDDLILLLATLLKQFDPLLEADDFLILLLYQLDVPGRTIVPHVKQLALQPKYFIFHIEFSSSISSLMIWRCESVLINIGWGIVTHGLAGTSFTNISFPLMRCRNLLFDFSEQGLVFTRPWLGIMFPDPEAEHRSSAISSSP